jgi:hypothetical protein
MLHINESCAEGPVIDIQPAPLRHTSQELYVGILEDEESESENDEAKEEKAVAMLALAEVLFYCRVTTRRRWRTKR